MKRGGDVQVLVLRQEHIAIERRQVFFNGNEPLREKWEIQIEPGGAHDHIIEGRVAIHEKDLVAVESRDGGAWCDAPMPQVMQQFKIESWNAHEELVLGARQAVTAVIADRDLQSEPEQQAMEP